MSTYQSQTPSVVAVIKKEYDEWQQENGVRDILVTGRISFPNIFRPGLDDKKTKSTGVNTPRNNLTCDVIIADLPINKKAIATLTAEFNKTAALMDTTWDDIAEPKLRHIPLDSPRLKKGKVVKDEDGEVLSAHNDGHYVIATGNFLDHPPKYFSLDGKRMTAKKKDEPEDDFDIYHIPVDPFNGERADNILYAGCFCRAHIQLKTGKDQDGDPKIWVTLVAIQRLQDDEPLGKGAGGNTDNFETFDDLFGATGTADESGMASDEDDEEDDVFG